MRARETESKGADPVRVFLILAAILVAIGAVFWLTRSDPIADTPANATSPNESPDFSLTNEEAIARFEELDELRQQAYAERDTSLILAIYATHSPARQRALKDLRSLRQDGVFSRTTFRTEQLAVSSNDADAIELQQTVIVDPAFESESGERLSEKNPTQRLRIRWELVRVDDEWLLFDSIIASSEELS